MRSLEASRTRKDGSSMTTVSGEEKATIPPPPPPPPPISCPSPRLPDPPRELRPLLCLLLLLCSTIAAVVWLSSWIEEDYAMTSVTSVRAVKPVPRLLELVYSDPSKLPVNYHGPYLARHGKGDGYNEQDFTHRVKDNELNKQGFPPPPPPPLDCMLLVLVESSVDNVDMRRSVRETWQSLPSVGVGVCVVFCVPGKGEGVTSEGVRGDKLRALEEESKAHKDIAIFPKSSQWPASELLLYQMFWAEQTISYNYLMKTRDSFYVRLEEVVHELRRMEEEEEEEEEEEGRRYLYWGYFEGQRNARKRWQGKQKEPDWFLCDRFIRFAHSGGYVVVRGLVQRLLSSALYLQLYQNEDIAMATWLSPFHDIHWKHDVRFDTDPGQSRGCLNSYLIFPVDSAADMRLRHQRLEEVGVVCRKEHKILQAHSYDFSVLPAYCCHPL